MHFPRYLEGISYPSGPGTQDQSKSPSSCTYGPFLLTVKGSLRPSLSAVSQAAGRMGLGVTALPWAPRSRSFLGGAPPLCLSRIKHRLHLKVFPLCHTQLSSFFSYQESDVLIAPTAICNCYWLVYLFVPHWTESSMRTRDLCPPILALVGVTQC